jgi:DNA-binding transcriptional MerR regulator
MYTIGQICKKFGFSRGTLLYYDSIGLLKPSIRAANNYRKYSDDDLKRLQQICLYREIGMSLEHIKLILESTQTNMTIILEKHLSILNDSIRKLQIQRQIIAQMVKNNISLNSFGVPLEVNLIKILKKIDINHDKLEKLHIEFERLFPDAHQDFLELLKLPSDEIEQIRKYSKKRVSES